MEAEYCGQCIKYRDDKTAEKREEEERERRQRRAVYWAGKI